MVILPQLYLISSLLTNKLYVYQVQKSLPVPHKASVRSGSLRLLQNSLSLDYYLSLASLLFTDSKYWFRYAPMRMIYIQKYIHSSTMMIMERLP